MRIIKMLLPTINIPCGSKNILDNLKIGIVNIHIPHSIFTSEHFRKIKQTPFLTDQKYMDDVLKIFDNAVISKVNLLLLPECSIPSGALDTVIDKAKKEQIAMVFGLQHMINDKNYAFNVQVTILPFVKNGVKDAYIDYRLKKYYSPEEERLLTGCGYKIPQDDNFSQHKIFVWNNVWFSSLNCFEFADINLRSSYKSQVDLLAISEYNPDVNYFSNLVESSARDIHCYIAQANSSNFGDSRVCSPSKTEQKDIIKVKGGLNSVVIVDKLKILELREFQRLNYELQKDRKREFKPTPPDFDKTHKRLA